ncbi:MFS transporter [uncultured Victivallis sp.]|uniref:MFS transporter n=1 Tax=uncultured Victivallis sp. TaxID=354118 RepID=UPI0025CDB489|nr:MFS transporter [uncultured Victivallis sp.]
MIDFQKEYSAGTLHYRLPKLLAVCIYLLWGGFCYSMLAYVLIPTLLPLTLTSFGAGGALIGLICGSIPSAMNMVMSPVLGASSDRLRTRWGRRIPYLAVSAPFVTFFMIMVGWTPEIAAWLYRILPEGSFSLAGIGIVLICVGSVLFQFFNLVVGNIYYWLMPDVLPHCVIGRFFSLINVVIALAGFVFNYFLLKYARDYAPWVFTLVGVLFLISFLPVCLLVKEGEYPPLTPMSERKTSWPKRLVQCIIKYCRECFGKTFFLVFFIGTALNQVSTACRNIFNPLFATRELGLSEAQYGHIMGIGSLCSIGAMLLAGYLIDKWHPLRVYILTGFIIIFLNFFGYFFVVDYSTFLVVGILVVIIYSLQNLTGLPMMVALMPEERFGQFASANSLVNCLLMILANYLGGLAIDLWGYRFMFVWDFIFTILAMVAMGYIYCVWRRNGCRPVDP